MKSNSFEDQVKLRNRKGWQYLLLLSYDRTPTTGDRPNPTAPAQSKRRDRSLILSRITRRVGRSEEVTLIKELPFDRFLWVRLLGLSALDILPSATLVHCDRDLERVISDDRYQRVKKDSGDQG